MGRANNNGKIIDPTIKTLSHPTNSTVRISSTTTLPLIQGQIQPTSSSNVIKPNQLSPYLPTEHNHTIITTTTTTTNVILDYLLFLSIHARIDQTKNELKGVEQLSSSVYNKKGQGVEAIVEGLLQSHRTQVDSMSLPLPLKHRLYLCQLLHLVFDRSHILTSGSSSLKSSQISQDSTNTLNHNYASTTLTNPMEETTTTTTTTKQRVHKLPTNLVKYEKLFKNALLSRCRKHRQSICKACQQHPSNSIITPPMTRRRSTPPKPIPTRRTIPGLIDAIPVFLNTCAITYRLAHDNELTNIKPMWYELLLDLLTQAAIECYFCDSYNSIDTLLEIFSYGDIDPSDYHSDDSESDDDDDDPHFAATRADDYLLWQRTAYLDEFRKKKKDRMEEFLNVKGKLEQHFENLASKYPIRKFETEMLNYCTDITGSLEPPALFNSNDNELSNELFHIPGRYNGGIDIPMSDDDMEDDYYVNDGPSQSENYNMDGKKRRLSESDGSKELFKKKKNEEVLSFQ